MVAAGYRSVLRQAVFALFGALLAFQLGVAGEVTRPPTSEIVQEVQKVLAEAEVLGLPSLAGATLFEGQLSLPNLTRWELSNASQYRHVHARLPDGSWLIDLIVPMPAARCRRAQLAALKPFVPGSPPEQRQRSGRRLSLENLQLLAAARRCAIGVPEAADFSLAQFDVGYSDFYPRVDKAQNVGDFVRLACRDHFLDLEQGEAAVAIAPERWRAATRRLVNRAPLPDPLPTGPVGLVASYLKPERGEEPGVDAPLLPAVDDATLVTLVGDRSPAAACGTVGETALYLLSQRWGIDAAILAGRDVASPLDDAEQDAIAAGLTAWWLRTKSQSMQQRWLEALQQVPVSSALMSLSNRKSIMDSRRSTVKDRLLYHTWSGDKAPEMPADDDAMIMEKYVQSLLTRWEKTTTIPADLDAKTWQTLMFQVDGSVGSSKLTAQEIRHRLDNERALAQRLDAIVMKWPRSGPLADSLLLWDDAHGRPDRLDARVEAALTKPALNQDEAQAALLLWMQRETPERYRRIEGLLARDPHDVGWQALFLLTVSSEETNTIFGMLAWSLLRDERPLPAEILSKELPHDEQRIALIVAKHLAAKYLATKYEVERVLMMPKMNGDKEVSLAALTRADATHSEQDAAIATLRSLYATRVAILYTTRALPIPADCIVPETSPAQPIEVLPVTSPDLTAEEAAEIRAVLTKAVSLGFPDLTGAKAVARDFPIGTNDWSGVHLRLADGSWLAESVHPVPATKLDTEPNWLKPMPGTRLNNANQMPSAARGRVSGDLAVGQLADLHGDSVLPALAWWLSGADATGQTVVATVLNEAVLGHDVADIWSIATGRGGKDRGNVETVPTIADGVRRSVARWFRHQVVWAKGGAATDHAIAAAKQMLPPADLPVWEPMLNLLRARLDIPEKEPAGADLAARLQSWKSTDKNAQGNWVRSSRKVPAKRADTAALVALLDDQRSTRWVTDYALPRPLGDAALEALGDLWGFDWRWLVVTDPAVAAILPPQRAQQRHQIDRGDEWLWASTNWTTERRAVIMPAIKAWWQARAPNAPSPLHDVFKTLPLPLWADVFDHLSAAEAGAAALGDILVERLRTMAPPKLEVGMEQYTLGVIMKFAVRQPRHAGLTALLASWPQQPWMEAVTALRAEYAGDPATFDRWMQESLELPPPVDDDDRDPATPWALVGIWAHHPTPLRLAALRRILTSDLNDSRLPWLVSKLGLYGWLGNWSLLPGGHKELTQAAAQAVPCALALDGLKDQRALKPSVRRALIHSVNSYYRNQIAKRLPADARICDWVAVQTIGEDGVLSDNKQGLIEVEAFLTAPRAQRDAAIATIIERLTFRCEERLQAAGMVPTPAPVPTGADNF